jgi:hypothetical protein
MRISSPFQVGAGVNRDRALSFGAQYQRVYIQFRKSRTKLRRNPADGDHGVDCGRYVRFGAPPRALQDRP